jgi:hypothetical protein
MNLQSSVQLMYLKSFQRVIQLQTWIKFPCAWTDTTQDIEEYESLYGDINYREILNNELVIDIDAENRENAVPHANLVEQDLDNHRLYYSRWLSGGNGIHFHLFYNKKEMVSLVMEYGYLKVKEHLLKYYIKEENQVPENIHSHVCFGPNRLICLEHSRHKKGKIKTLTKNMFGRKLNRIPDEVKESLRKEKEIKEEGRIYLEKIRQENPTYSLPCSKFISGENTKILNVFELRDGLYRLMYIYISQLIAKGLSEEQIYEKVIIWRDKFNKDWLYHSKHKVTNSHIKYMIKAGRGEVGCNFISTAFSEIGASKICKSCLLKREIEE